MPAKYLCFILFFLFFSCNRDFLLPLPHPDELKNTRLIPLDVGKSWNYSHHIVDTLTMGAIHSDTVKWSIDETITINDKEYYKLTNNMLARENANGLFFADYDEKKNILLSEIFFKIPVQHDEQYFYTFENRDTSITYGIYFYFTPVRNGEEYWASSYAVNEIDGVKTNRGATFAFRAGKYLIAIDRFPTPPYHFWRIIF